ncbi:unnamed protein product [Phytophthora fragariaefolia]|uniref:Unnamed protein product n=1 Tax=Phytophthora fragariaefolia TaxID=1490495 RepID=A0A9W6YAW3_9STRA|nr:unnamed protein product [Phytophthora fragariaefolia]
MADNKSKSKDKDEKKSHPPFDGKNFEVWLERITLKLERKGLWKYCKGEVPEPNEKSSASDHELWKMEMNRTKELLYDAMTDEIVKSVKYEQTPFREVRRLMDHVALLGKPLDDYIKPAMLIGSLSTEYDNVVETFLASHVPRDINDPPNYEQLEHALEIVYDRRQGRKLEQITEDKAFLVAQAEVVVEVELVVVEVALVAEALNVEEVEVVRLVVVATGAEDVVLVVDEDAVRSRATDKDFRLAEALDIRCRKLE